MKRLSIIVPVYNVELYLRDCLLSLLSQNIDKSDYEIILVNDGSTDNSINTIFDIISKYPNTIVLINKENEGLSVARNVGLSIAKGTYVIFVDSDDCIVDGTLHLLLNAAEENEVDMLRADYVKLEDSEVNSYISSLKLPGNIVSSQVLTGQEGLTLHNTRECYIWMNMFKRSLLLDNKIEFMPHMVFEDILFTLESYLKSERFCILPLKFYIYRQRKGSVIATMKPDRLISLNTIIQHSMRLGKSMNMADSTRKALENTIFDSMSIGLWYLSHYKSLFPFRKEVLQDLKAKNSCLWFSGSLKQIFVSVCLLLCPVKYIEFIYFTTRHKY